MDNTGLLSVLLFVFIVVFCQSDARILVTTPVPDNAEQDSLSTSPPPPDKKPVLHTIDAPKPKDKRVTNPSDLEYKGLNDTYTKEGNSKTSSDKKLDTGKDQEVKGSKTFASELCKGNPICSDHGKTMTACVQDFENGSDNLTLIVQNEQDLDLQVNMTYGTPVKNIFQPFEIPAHATEKVNITFSGDKSNKVILRSGNGECELQISQPKHTPVNTPNFKDPENSQNTPKVKDVDNPADSTTKPKDVVNSASSPIKPKEFDNPSKSKDEIDHLKSKDVDDLPKSTDTDDLSKLKDVDELSKPTSINTPVSSNSVFDRLTFFSKQVTPIYGAYLAFFVALVIGGSWALCSFRKRRNGGGIPYQELEMGPSESTNAVDVEAAEGWDQDWDDDDWDEDKAIRSPGGSLRGKAISSSGLTSRDAQKDSWDADWDD